MAQVEVRDRKNKVVEKLELADEVFSYEASPTLVWEALRAFRLGQRKGTHAGRNRSAVRGGGRKPWRQKGTGRARAGTIRSPLWKGGGTVKGPFPRDYSLAFPKKKKRGALKLVLSDKLKNNRLVVLSDLALESHRTRDFVKLLDALEVKNKALIVDEAENRNLYLGSRNVPSVKMVASGGLNIYDLLNHDILVITKQAILDLQEVLKR